MESGIMEPDERKLADMGNFPGTSEILNYLIQVKDIEKTEQFLFKLLSTPEMPMNWTPHSISDLGSHAYSLALNTKDRLSGSVPLKRLCDCIRLLGVGGMFSGFLQAAAYKNFPNLDLVKRRTKLSRPEVIRFWSLFAWLFHDAVPLAPAVIMQLEALLIWLIVRGL